MRDGQISQYDLARTDERRPAGMRALTADPALTVIVRPDRVVAAVEPRYRLPRLPWYVPARGTRTAILPQPAHPARPQVTAPAASSEAVQGL